ncbi:DUF4339 domain-containing protein [Termitidicoccus mucosus]|uniref:GYF domain-containing protein n=1 Tax=Termitidicoccus mucosus TaxID=1184151 RepID=A0A178ILK3_9BACT|nr:hypothetical protein AW736_06855 [Opitutaceae bacterium TSB47]
MSDTQHEFYIRSASDDEARGPFTFDQLAQLAVRGQLTRDMLYYEAESEQWVAIGGNTAISSRLFSRAAASPPPGARQRADKDDEAGTSSGDGNAAAPASLAASPSLPRRPACIALLLAGALALVLPFFITPAAPADSASGIAKILTHPFVLLGAIDLVLAFAVLAAGVSSSLGKIIRLRAAVGLGFLGSLFWLQEQPAALGAALLAAAGLWFATFAATRRGLAFAATAGLAGIVFLAYCLAS